MKKPLLALSVVAIGVTSWISAQCVSECPAASDCCWSPTYQYSPCTTPCPAPSPCTTPALPACSQQTCRPMCQPQGSCCGSFEVGGEALYWKACGYNEAFAVTFVVPGIIPIGQPQPLIPHSFHSRYEWGFKLFCRYYTCDHCHTIGLDWIHHHSRKRNHIEALTPSFIQSLAFSENVGIYHTCNWRVRTRYDAVDLDFGRRLLSCGCKEGTPPCCGSWLYLFASLRYVDIEDKYNAFFEEFGDAPGFQTLRTHNRDTFRGGGPRIGIFFRHELFCGLGIAGRIASSVLVGDRHSRALAETENVTPQLFFVTRKEHNGGGCCVPHIDAKLGIDYCFTCCMTFKIEAGWAWEHAFHALTHYRIKAAAAEEGLARDFQSNRYDFDLGGVYIRGSVSF